MWPSTFDAVDEGTTTKAKLKRKGDMATANAEALKFKKKKNNRATR